MLPGMPTANSMPLRPSSAALREAAAKETPLPKVSVQPSTAISFSILPSLITRPRMPLSRTSRLEPLPISVTGTFASPARCSSCCSSCSLCGIAIRSAGPPIRKDVCFAIGSSASKGLAVQPAKISCNVIIYLPLPL